ncbi:GNAT family N-acetyltransferase [Candidatus Agathobaculum pullicola]|uniref:GNAT family N-acetyltransferase n=1 Tax=Candidatus Agathobaculum pullicola TaxID=2838426 RepID=UPI003F92C25C
MEIRHTQRSDLPLLLEIFAHARRFMAENGNPNQWGDHTPTQQTLEEDIAAGHSYVCIQDGRIAATFFLSTAGEPTYRVIREGAWLDDAPYGVVHRIAAAEQGHGAAAYCLEWCLERCGNIRIDTHRDNKPMQRLLQRLGYTYCGRIDLENGRGERLAFQKRLKKA